MDGDNDTSLKRGCADPPSESLRRRVQPILTRAKLSPTFRLYDQRHSWRDALLSVGGNSKSFLNAWDTRASFDPRHRRRCKRSLRGRSRHFTIKMTAVFALAHCKHTKHQRRSSDRIHYYAKVLYKLTLRGAGCRS